MATLPPTTALFRFLLIMAVPLTLLTVPIGIYMQSFRECTVIKCLSVKEVVRDFASSNGKTFTINHHSVNFDSHLELNCQGKVFTVFVGCRSFPVSGEKGFYSESF